jgi:hypothetical protein
MVQGVNEIVTRRWQKHRGLNHRGFRGIETTICLPDRARQQMAET